MNSKCRNYNRLVVTIVISKSRINRARSEHLFKKVVHHSLLKVKRDDQMKFKCGVPQYIQCNPCKEKKG